MKKSSVVRVPKQETLVCHKRQYLTEGPWGLAEINAATVACVSYLICVLTHTSSMPMLQTRLQQAAQSDCMRCTELQRGACCI